MPFVVDDDDVLGEQDGEAQAAAVMDARPAMLRPPWTRREACRKARRPAAILISVGGDAWVGCELAEREMRDGGHGGCGSAGDDEAPTKSMQARRYPSGIRNPAQRTAMAGTGGITRGAKATTYSY